MTETDFKPSKKNASLGEARYPAISHGVETYECHSQKDPFGNMETFTL